MRKICKAVISLGLILVLLSGCVVNNEKNISNFEAETDTAVNDAIIEKLQYIADEKCEELEDVNIVFSKANPEGVIAESGSADVKVLPGSLIKYITLGIAINEGLIDGSEEYECTGSYVVEGQNIHCYDRKGHGKISLTEGIKQSCYMSYVNIAERIDNKVFCDYMKMLGFDVNLSNGETLTDVEKIQIALGQKIQMTPYELLNAYNKIFIEETVLSENNLELLYKIIAENEGEPSCFGGKFQIVSENEDESLRFKEAVLLIAMIDEKKVIGTAFSGVYDREFLTEMMKDIVSEYV